MRLKIIFGLLSLLSILLICCSYGLGQMLDHSTTSGFLASFLGMLNVFVAVILFFPFVWCGFLFIVWPLDEK